MVSKCGFMFLVILGVHLVICDDPVETDSSSSLESVGKEELNEDSFGGGTGQRTDREKRLGLIKKIGLKAILLNLIFGKIDGFLDSKTRLINQLDKQNVVKNQKYFGWTPPPKRPPQGKTTTAPAVEFSTSSPVSLVIPDRLYGNSFSLITNISQTLGDVLFNTAARAQEFTDRINGKIRRKFNFLGQN